MWQQRGGGGPAVGQQHSQVKMHLEQYCSSLSLAQRSQVRQESIMQPMPAWSPTCEHQGKSRGGQSRLRPAIVRAEGRTRQEEVCGTSGHAAQPTPARLPAQACQGYMVWAGGRHITRGTACTAVGPCCVPWQRRAALRSALLGVAPPSPQALPPPAPLSPPARLSHYLFLKARAHQLAGHVIRPG